ncbi:MAG: GntR family transcriptional regulator [Chloroflexi bacterium]|nr:GntR family transcriptional regulator [Chloroflexota bacterium]
MLSAHKIDKRSPLPLYAQLQELFRAAILSGELPPGSQLPGEEELGRQYGLSRLTVRRALQDLQHEGLIRTERGRGSFVAGFPTPVGNGISLIMAHLHHVFHLDLIRGIEGELKRAGYHVITRYSRNDPDEESRDIGAALRDRNAAILLFPSVGFANADLIRGVLARGIPVTFVDRWYPGLPADVVTEDNVRGGYLAASHLVERGHRRIGFLTSAEHQTTAVEERLAGYRQALEEAAIPYDPILVTAVPPAPDEGDASPAMPVASSLIQLTRSPHDVTAFVGCHDRAALTALRTLREAGLRVPDDVALTGFNDYPWAANPDVSLTTVAPRPWEELGARAARLTVDRLQRPGGEPRREVLPVQLVVRGSTSVQNGDSTKTATRGGP